MIYNEHQFFDDRLNQITTPKNKEEKNLVFSKNIFKHVSKYIFQKLTGL